MGAALGACRRRSLHHQPPPLPRGWPTLCPPLPKPYTNLIKPNWVGRIAPGSPKAAAPPCWAPGCPPSPRAPRPLRPPPRASRELGLHQERTWAPRLEADGAPSRAAAAPPSALRGRLLHSGRGAGRLPPTQVHIPGPWFSKTTSPRGPLAPELVFGTCGWGRPPSAGRLVWGGQQGALRKGQFIHSLGAYSGGSCCGREEPARSALAVPFNPSQPGPEGQTVRTRPGPTAAPRPLGLHSVPVLAKRGKKLRGSSTHFEGPTGCSTLSAEESEALPLLSAVHGGGWGGW